MTAFWTLQERLVCQSQAMYGSGVGQRFNLVISSSRECLNLHLGNPQSANLGDGNGFVNETVKHTSTLESMFIVFYVDGASSRLFWSSLWHLLGEFNWREPFPVSVLLLMKYAHWKMQYSLYRQNGPTANSSALFLAWVLRVVVLNH